MTPSHRPFTTRRFVTKATMNLSAEEVGRAGIVISSKLQAPSMSQIPFELSYTMNFLVFRRLWLRVLIRHALESLRA